jgi:predicted DCC family thiol-disulfide oxidoreductase YuxK
MMNVCDGHGDCVVVFENKCPLCWAEKRIDELERDIEDMENAGN